MQGHALRMQESVGAHSLPTVINTLWALYSDIDRTIFVYDAEGAMKGLVRLGYARLEREGEAIALPADETKRYLHLSERLHWDEQHEYWHWMDEQEIDSVELVLTEPGKRALRQ